MSRESQVDFEVAVSETRGNKQSQVGFDAAVSETVVITALRPAGIQSGEAHGSTVLQTTVAISPEGLPSNETFGTPALINAQLISPGGIPSTEGFGTTAVIRSGIVFQPDGREPIGVSQEPGQGGWNYPLLFPSADVYKLLADAYLAYDDRTNRYRRPFRIDFLYGFGTAAATVPITPVHSHEVRVVDALDQVVFDSLTVPPSNFRTLDWANRLRVLEWLDGTSQVLRLVYHTAWDPNDSDAHEYPVYIEPASAELDARALYQLPRRVTSLRVGLTQLKPDANGDGSRIRLLNGFNTELGTEDTVEPDGRRRSTMVRFNALAGSGRGRFGPGCDETFPPVIRRVNNVTGGPGGNLGLDATGCYRIERPVQAVIAAADPNVTPEQVRIRDHTLRFSNDCGPCCECEDFIHVWEAIRRLRDRYADLVARAQATRDLYHANRDRWLKALECRDGAALRAVLQPVPGNEVGISIAYCNSSEKCLHGVVFAISFAYTEAVRLECLEHGEPLAANTTAVFLGIVEDATSRTGNVDPQNRNTGGKPSQQEFYRIGGEYPHFFAYFDAINPHSMGSISFRTLWEPDSEAIIEVIADAYEVGSNPIVDADGNPIPGYVPGSGPMTTPLEMRLINCPIKRAGSLIGSLETSTSESISG